VSRLATAAPVDSLAPAEVNEMKEHLGFLRRFKDILRLKLNAAEDLLVNGQREPSDRGVCRHLIGKVDRSVIEAAINREPLRSDPASRARMLAGAVRLTADVGVLLAYLESLAHVRSKAEAAQAFGEVVGRIDFTSLSATRVARLLQVLVETFVDHERVQVLFNLLGAPAFRSAFDAAAGGLPPDVARVCAPLRAVHRRLVEGVTVAEPSALLAAGLEQVLSAPDPVLRAYPEALRVGMLELALAPDVPPALGDRAAGVLLASVPHASKTYAHLALRRAGQLLARHADDRARVVLDELHRAQPGLRPAERWLAALGTRRLGRIALEGALPERGRLASAFWLDLQRPAWVRSAAASEAGRLAAEATLQAALAVPGVAPVVEHGVGSGIPYIAVVGPGRPFVVDGANLDLPTALALAATAARLLRVLALAGASLPDAAPERFLHASPLGLVLADLDGITATDAGAAACAHVAHALFFARQMLAAAGARPDEILDPPSDDLVQLVGLLDAAALRARRD
jgi:hypothetical protein